MSVYEMLLDIYGEYEYPGSDFYNRLNELSKMAAYSVVNSYFQHQEVWGIHEWPDCSPACRAIYEMGLETPFKGETSRTDDAIKGMLKNIKACIQGEGKVDKFYLPRRPLDGEFGRPQPWSRPLILKFILHCFVQDHITDATDATSETEHDKFQCASKAFLLSLSEEWPDGHVG